MARIAIAVGIGVLGAVTGGLGLIPSIFGATLANGGTAAALMGGLVGFGVGSTLGNIIAPGHLPNQYGPRLSDLTVSSSANGAMIPIGYGTCALGANVIWSPGLVEHSTTTTTSSGGKGGPSVSTTSYTYTISFAAAFGEGPGTVLKVWFDSKVGYDGSGGAYVNYKGAFNSGTAYSVGDIVLSGGKYYILAIPWTSLPTPSPTTPPFGTLIWNPYNGTIITTSTQKYPSPVLYSGTDTQMPDPTIQAAVGVNLTSAFRGLIYAVWTDLPLADFGNRLPNIRGVVQFGTVGSVANVGIKSGSLSGWGWNSTTNGAFNKAHTQTSSDFTFTPASLYWQGATGQNTQIATLNTSGVVTGWTDTGHYENWEASVTFSLIVNSAGTYAFNLSHDDGAMIGVKLSTEQGGTVTKISGTVVNNYLGTTSARQGFTFMAGNNNSGSWPTDPFSFSVAGGTYPAEIKCEIVWTNWEHASRLILTTSTGAQLVTAVAPGTSTDTTSVEYIVTDICKRSNIDSSLIDATDLAPTIVTPTPSPGTLTNAVSIVFTGGGFFYYQQSWDINSTAGEIYQGQFHSIGGASAVVKARLSGTTLSVVDHIDSIATWGIGGPNIIADPVDGTVLISGSSKSVKYDWNSNTTLLTVSGSYVPNSGIVPSNGWVKSNEQFLSGNTFRSAHDFSSVGSYNGFNYTTNTFYNAVWDDPSRQRLLASEGGVAGVGHNTAKIDLTNPHYSGLTELLDSNSLANPSGYTNITNYASGIMISQDGAYGVANHGNFVDFFDMATMTLIAHVNGTFALDVVIDDENIAYVRNGNTVYAYDCATGSLNGTLGTFTLGSGNLDAGIGIMFHPTDGTWLIMHNNGNLQGMFIRGVPTPCQADPITACQGYLISRPSDGRTLVTQLAQAYFFDAVESDFMLKFIRRGVHDSVMTIPEDDLGLVKDKAKLIEAIKMEQDASQTVTILHFDPAIDYQQGSQIKRRSSRVVKTRNQSIIELPIVMNQTQAKQIAEKTLYLQWLERQPWTFNLWKAVYMVLDPTDVCDFFFEGVDYQQRILTSTIGQDYTVAMGGVAHDSCAYASLATPATPGGSNDSGTGVVIPTASAASDTVLYLFDIPYLLDTDASLDRLQSGIYYVLSSPASSGWPGGVLLQSGDSGNYNTIGSTALQTSFGTATGTLADPPSFCPWAWDTTSTLNIAMTFGTLSGVTDADVYAGKNALLVGNEVIQFVDCVQEMDGTFTISRLLRGRRNTEQFATGHASGENVIAINTGILHAQFADNFVGATKNYKGVTVGADPTLAGVQSFTSSGVDLKPAFPVHITGVWDANNNMTLSWIRRTRFGGKGLVGPTPLNEDYEAYDVEIYNGATLKRTISWTGSVDGNGNPVQFYSAADQTTDGFTAGTDPVTVKIYQKSAQVGRGFPGTATVAAIVGTITGITTGGSGGTSGGTGGTGSGSTGTNPFDFAWYFNGLPTASFEILRVPVDRALTLPAGLLGAQAVCKTAASDGTATFTIQKISGGVTTTIGTCAFAVGATVGTYSFASTVTLAQGDILVIIAPSSSDSTLASPGGMLAATR